MRDTELSQLFHKLKNLLPDSNFKIQPETSKKELEEFENKYGISTLQLLKTKYNHIPEDMLDKWIQTYETYLRFRGDE